MPSKPLKKTARCREEYKDFFAAADRCLRLGKNIINSLDKLKFIDRSLSKYQIILGFNFYKATNSFRAVMQLCSKGYCGDAMAIARKMIEIAVNLKYLSLSIDKRTDLYCSFASISHDKLMEDIRRETSESEEVSFSNKILKQIEEMNPKIAKACEIIKQEYKRDRDGRIDWKIAANWSGISLKKMAEKCQMTEDYIAYRVYSSKVHASIEEIVSHYDFDSGHFSFELEKKDIPWVLMETMKMYAIICTLVIKAFGFEQADAIKTVNDKLKKLKEHPMLSKVQ